MQSTATATTATTTQISNVPPVKEIPVNVMNGEGAMHHPVQVVDEKKESPSAEGYTPHDAAMLASPHLMNGLPPSQVYVDTTRGYHGMMGIETHFQSLGMHDANDSSNHEDSEGNDGTGEGSNEEDAVKLFIGQVSTVYLFSIKIVTAGCRGICPAGNHTVSDCWSRTSSLTP